MKPSKIIWYFWFGLSLLTVVLSAWVAVSALRQNNLLMDKLRQEVFLADKNDGDIEAALGALRRHVLLHMNADLVDFRLQDQVGSEEFFGNSQKPIQLVHKYYRDSVAKHQETLVLYGPEVQAVLPKAEALCQAQEIGPSEQLSCLVAKTKEIGNETYPLWDFPNKDYYVFDFVSPRWSPDRAGWSLVIFWLAVASLTVSLVVRLFKAGRVLLSPKNG